MSTIQELYTEAVSLLGGSPGASVESKVLVLRSLSLSEETFYAHPDRPVSESEKQRFYDFVRQRQKGVPLAYVIGEKEFWGLPFRVSPAVLIPRPETELLVEKVIELSAKSEEVIADIGTGSGNIAVSLAKELPRSRIVATDISEDALRTARLNASLHDVPHIAFLNGDLFSPLAELHLEGACDFIVSNPPYVPEDQWETLQDDIRHHEPRLALVPGETGLEFVGKLAAGAPEFLKRGGYLCMEIGCGQQDDALRLFGEGWESVDCHKDLSGIPRIITARKKT